LLKAVSTFEFLFTAFVLADVFKEVNVLSVLLQSVDLDYCRAITIAKYTMDRLRKKNDKSSFKIHYSKAIKLCEELAICLPELPRKRTLPK